MPFDVVKKHLMIYLRMPFYNAMQCNAFWYDTKIVIFMYNFYFHLPTSDS